MKFIKSFFKSLPRDKSPDELFSIITSAPEVRAWLLGLADQYAATVKTRPVRNTGGRPAYDEEQFLDVIRELTPDVGRAKSKSELARAISARRGIAMSTAHSIINRLRDRELICVDRKPGDMFELVVYWRPADEV